MNNKLYKNWKIIVGILLILVIIVIFFINYNGLSKRETMEKFLNLVSQSEYDKAKKYITNNFKWDLASVKKQNLKYAESFTYNYGNYYLDDDYDIAYIVDDAGLLIGADIIKFRVKYTIFGNKIDGYCREIIKY